MFVQNWSGDTAVAPKWRNAAGTAIGPLANLLPLEDLYHMSQKFGFSTFFFMSRTKLKFSFTRRFHCDWAVESKFQFLHVTIESFSVEIFVLFVTKSVAQIVLLVVDMASVSTDMGNTFIESVHLHESIIIQSLQNVFSFQKLSRFLST